MTTKIVRQAKKEGRAALNEVESKELLAKAGIPVVPTKLARTKAEAVALARELGLPVALKIVSPQILHKTDIGGVALGLSSAAQVARAYTQIIAAARERAPGAQVTGVSVQPMAPPGVEVIIGLTKDPQFGPVLMFGLGGVLVEIIKDVSFRIVPLERRDAAQMIREIKGFPLLTGYRGSKPTNLRSLEKILMSLSAFAEKNPEIKEIDLNPIFARPDGAVAVDARVILE